MGAYVMALLYSLYYAVSRKARCGTTASRSSRIYMAFLVWHTYYALLTLRNTGGARARPPTPVGEFEVTVVGRPGLHGRDPRGGLTMLRRSPMSCPPPRAVQTILGLLMLPLSALPICIYLTNTPVGVAAVPARPLRASCRRRPPQLDPASATYARRAYAKLSVDGVPVLVYRASARRRECSTAAIVSRTNFAEQMRALEGRLPSDPVEQPRPVPAHRRHSAAAPKARPGHLRRRPTEAMLQADPILRAPACGPRCSSASARPRRVEPLLRAVGQPFRATRSAAAGSSRTARTA